MVQGNGVDGVGKREEIVVVLEVECILGVDICACFCISASNIIIIVEERVLKIKLTSGDKSAIGSLIHY